MAKVSIKVIGSRALNPVADKRIKKHASILIYFKNKKIQIDAGNPNIEKPDILLITHAGYSHSDHIKNIKEYKKCQIFTAKNVAPDLAKKISEFKILDYKYQDVAGLKVMPFKVEHGRVQAVGYRIKIGKKVMVYLPDFGSFQGASKYFKNVDLLFLDSSTFSRDIARADYTIHKSIKNSLKFLKGNKLLPKKLYLIHIGRTLMPIDEKIKELKKICKNIDYCYDGKRVKL